MEIREQYKGKVSTNRKRASKRRCNSVEHKGDEPKGDERREAERRTDIREEPMLAPVGFIFLS